MVDCCFTSTKTIRLIRDGEPRTATSTFTQPLSYAGVMRWDVTFITAHISALSVDLKQLLMWMKTPIPFGEAGGATPHIMNSSAELRYLFL